MQQKEISELVYENLINYRICETMYIEMKKTNYNTFPNMCSNLRDSIRTNSQIRGGQFKVLNHTIKNMVELYELEYEDSVRYIKEFLDNNMWEKYHEIVVIFYDKTTTSYQ